MTRATILVGLALASACSREPAMSTVDALATSTIDTTLPLQGGQLAEGLWSAKPGDSIVIRLLVPLPDLDWDIHAHPDGGTQTIIAEFARTSVDYNFSPPSDQQWFLLVRNHGSDEMDLQVHLEMYGGATWAGWQ